MIAPAVLVAPGPEVLAAAVAARLITRLVDDQAARGAASVVLTGGTIGIAALRAVRDSPARDAVDWRRVDVWWGDERWVARDSPDRNERQARAALLDALDLDPARVHPMAAPGDAGDDPDEAAARYAEALAGAAPADGAPGFDVVMLGMGAEGHVASIFPGSPAARDERTVVAVRGCPKPPPTRLSLGLRALNAAQEVWLIVAGAEKAPVVALALQGADPLQVPAAGAAGRTATRWLLVEAASA